MDEMLKKHGWRETKLGEIADIIKDAWKPTDEHQAYIGLEHINEQDLTINGIGNSSGLESNKFRFKAGDILFGKLRPYFRKVVVVDFDGVCSTDIWVIRAKQNHDQKFLFYFMANPVLIDKSMGASTGSRMPRADWNFLESTHWYVPQRDEQRAIAAVLSSLDNKIELLRNQNKTLEAIAQGLFNEWFVEFNFPNSDGKPYKKSGGKMVDGELGEIPDGWRVGRLGKVVNLKQGKYTEAEKISDTKTDDMQFPIYGGNGIRGYLLDFVYETPQVVLTCRGNGCGLIQFTEPKATVTNSCMALEDIDSELNANYLYLLTKKMDFESVTSGSAQPQITVKNVQGLEIIVPEKKILEKFNQAIRPMFEKVRENDSQIQTLSILRDSLLPRMMSGEVRVES